MFFSAGKAISLHPYPAIGKIGTTLWGRVCFLPFKAWNTSTLSDLLFNAKTSWKGCFDWVINVTTIKVHLFTLVWSPTCNIHMEAILAYFCSKKLCNWYFNLKGCNSVGKISIKKQPFFVATTCFGARVKLSSLFLPLVTQSILWSIPLPFQGKSTAVCLIQTKDQAYHKKMAFLFTFFDQDPSSGGLFSSWFQFFSPPCHGN